MVPARAGPTAPRGDVGSGAAFSALQDGPGAALKAEVSGLWPRASKRVPLLSCYL
jgi:hypothetical protein